MRIVKFFLVLLLFCLAPVVLAQEDCPAIVNAALNAVDSACSATGRNQVCYGNIHLTATPQDGKTLTFEKSGDIADVADVKTLELSSMSISDSSWGVALMELQANLPDSVPGQNVPVLLFGNVEINSVVEPLVELDMTAQQGVNVRLRPTTSASIVTSLKTGQAIIANGRVPDGSWVRVKLDQGSGWVATNFLSTTGDVGTLKAVSPSLPVYGPMQSFYFKSGTGDRPCAEAPDSGILIQTPKGAGRVTLTVNAVDITLGSTAYLQAQPSGVMTVTVVEGEATLTAQGQTMLVPAGTQSQVSLSEIGRAAGRPSVPKPYDLKALQTLPLSVKAFTKVQIATPLTDAQIQAALATPTPAPPVVASGGTTVQSGDVSDKSKWDESTVTTVDTCNNPSSAGAGGYALVTLTFSPDRSSVVWNAPGWTTFTLSRVGDSVYQGVNQVNQTITLTFTSNTSYHLSWLAHYPPYSGGPGCDFNMEGDGRLHG